jgi:hypothetical protein
VGVGRGRWALVISAMIALGCAVLFAVLPYTLPLQGGGDPGPSTQTRCDAAVVQVFGSPSPGGVEQSHGSARAVLTIPNVESSCDPVAHYRLGIAAGLLILALALGGVVLMSLRRERGSDSPRQSAATSVA